MTRPMSFMPEAPVSAMIAGIAALGFFVAHLRGKEALDDRDFGFLGRGELLAVALAVELGRFAALLDHFLQHFGDQQVVVRRAPSPVRSSMSRFLIADWTRRSVPVRGLVAAFHRGNQRGLDVVADHRVP